VCCASCIQYHRSRTTHSTAGRLQLTRPLVAFDLETTGLDVKKDRIVEFAAVRLRPLYLF